MSHENLPTPLPIALSAQRIAGGTHIASAVYGIVISLAVIGAWYADPTSGALETLTSVLATLVVFWIAHTYAHVVGQGLAIGKASFPQIGEALRHDWPIVQSGFLPIAVLALGSLELIEERLSMLLAIVAGGLVLTVLSIAMARAAGRTWLQSLWLSSILVVLGIFVAVLEIKLG